MGRKGVPEVRGNKPKPRESRVRRWDDVGLVDKFMNYCGKPVTSEVTFGQTGFMGLWSVDSTGAKSSTIKALAPGPSPGQTGSEFCSQSLCGSPDN